MLFNSRTFVVFFLVVYAAYLALRRHHRAQNVFLLVASCVFYGAWNYRFLALLAISSGIDFVAAIRIRDDPHPNRKKVFLLLSLVSNLTILGVFKYFNFFAASMVQVFHALGMRADAPTLSVALPVGISFYTFQAMSYVIDVYRGDLEPTRDLLDYLLFIAFFPHLVAGPIQRPNILLPQVTSPRKLDWAQINAGIYLVIWGYLKKVVVADNMALVADPIFDHYVSHAGIDILIGALAFTFQIYGDFSGYSDIARGISKLMGFDLMVNFKLPYFAVNPADFWRRWHVSLSTWLRDYLYISLGGNRGERYKTYRNLLLTMILGGLWHGAAWNFVLWGAFHGLLLIGYRVFDKPPERGDPWSGRYSGARVVAKILLMFSFTVFGWILFRSRSFGQVVGMLARVGFHASKDTFGFMRTLGFFLIPFLFVEFWQYEKSDLLAPAKLRAWALGPLYGLMLVWIVVFGVRESIEFIYFQF